LQLAANKSKALANATAKALAALEGVDLAGRCASLALPGPRPDDKLRVRMLGDDLEFELPEFADSVGGSNRQAHPIDRLLLLHYLRCERPVKPTGEWITFRQFPGGQFYWRPFTARTVEPLAAEIGDDLALLRDRLSRLDWTPAEAGDLGARIHVLAEIEVLLIYWKGCERLPARADVLFDSALARVYPTEDAVAIAGRLCRKLTVNKCSPCVACGLCEVDPTCGV